MPDIIPSWQSGLCEGLAFRRWSGPDRALLAQRAGHVIFGFAVARLALAAGDEHLWRTFFGRIGVEALAFLVAFALAELVGARLAVRRAVGGHHTGSAPGDHQRRPRHVRQAFASILC